SHRRCESMASDVARDVARYPTHDGHAFDSQHRVVPQCRVREGTASLQPPDVRNGRRHLDLPLPRRSGVEQPQLCGGDRPVPGLHRLRNGHVRESHLAASGGNEPVVIQRVGVPSMKAARRPSGIRDTKGYRVFTVVNTALLLAVCAIMLYPFLTVLAQSFSSSGAIKAGQVNLIPVGFNVETYAAVGRDKQFWT